MAEKEERICIDVINAGVNCVYRSDHNPKGQALCTHNGEMEPVTAKECRHCLEGMTRQEAIERMAKKIDEAYIDENGCNKGLTMEELAEAALNALLEGK